MIFFLSFFLFFFVIDDPYYCGLRARVPNFAKSSSKPTKLKDSLVPKRLPPPGTSNLQHPASMMGLHQLHKAHSQPHYMMSAHHHHQHHMMMHSRSFESGIGKTN